VKKYAIIVAGGNGRRMDAAVPKQFMLLSGKPVLMHTIRRFFEADPGTEVIIVLPANETGTWKELCVQHSFDIPHHVAKGGETRFQSVKNALEWVKEKSLIAVHDGARPFVSIDLITRSFSEAEQYGNAVPVIPLNESIRSIANAGNKIADRDSFVMVQTPQCFSSEILVDAYRADYRNEFTDDASVVESLGQSIHLIEGERENIKITFPVDFTIGEAILKRILSGK
jgi:2-C-methyl-D-erythritol 4-phosphate cytidylyltransferase